MENSINSQVIENMYIILRTLHLNCQNSKK